MKKIIVTLLLSFILMNVTAQTTFSVDNIRYKATTDSTVEVSSSPQYTGIIEIPDTVLYLSMTYTVTSIGAGAFYSCAGLHSLTIPSSVRSIGNSAFSGCTGLTSIDIPSSDTLIGDWAFSGCTGLTSIAIPSSVTSISSCTFYGCSGLTSLTIPTSVTSIGADAFNGCTGLTTIAIPSSITSIESFAFYGCTALKQYIVDSSNSNYLSIEGVLFTKNDTTLVAYPNGKSSEYTIPSSVTSIGIDAFNGCSGLTSISIPSSVTYIGNSAFEGCTGLTSIAIPSSVTSIGSFAFYGCTALKQYIVDSSNTKYSSLEGVLFTKNDTTLIAFPNGKSSEYTIPSSVTSIETRAFFGCTGLLSIAIPSSVTSIGTDAFYGCSGLTSLSIPSSVTSIGSDAFSGCTQLSEIHCQMGTPLSITSFIFSSVNKDSCKLYVPTGSSSAYRAAPIWGNFATIIEEQATAIQKTDSKDITIYTEQDAIVIKGADLGEAISVFSISGVLLKVVKASSDVVRILVSSNQIYLVKIGNRTFKAAL